MTSGAGGAGRLVLELLVVAVVVAVVVLGSLVGVVLHRHLVLVAADVLERPFQDPLPPWWFLGHFNPLSWFWLFGAGT